jgi:hypothetical protein
MSDFFQLFNPGARHQEEQRDLEKILVVDEEAGGTGPKSHNLDSGEVTIRMPKRRPAAKQGKPKVDDSGDAEDANKDQ